MLELTKKPLTEGGVELTVKLAGPNAAVYEREIEALIKRLDASLKDEEQRWYTIDEVFPDRHPGMTLAGARGVHGLTQATLAERIGAKKSHISEMERGLRPIGKTVARKLAKVFNTDYRVFL